MGPGWIKWRHEFLVFDITYKPNPLQSILGCGNIPLPAGSTISKAANNSISVFVPGVLEDSERARQGVYLVLEAHFDPAPALSHMAQHLDFFVERASPISFGGVHWRIERAYFFPRSNIETIFAEDCTRYLSLR